MIVIILDKNYISILLRKNSFYKKAKPKIFFFFNKKNFLDNRLLSLKNHLLANDCRHRFNLFHSLSQAFMNFLLKMFTGQNPFRERFLNEKFRGKMKKALERRKPFSSRKQANFQKGRTRKSENRMRERKTKQDKLDSTPLAFPYCIPSPLSTFTLSPIFSTIFLNCFYIVSKVTLIYMLQGEKKVKKNFFSPISKENKALRNC